MWVALLALAAIACAVSFWLHGQPPGGTLGQRIYSDTGPCRVEQSITSRRLRLTGKPDYIYDTQGLMVPVEVKSRPAGRDGPRQSDVMQVLTYCVLIEDVWGAPVSHGIIEYADKKYVVPYGPEERQKVLDTAAAIRLAYWTGKADRSHEEPWRCGPCGYRARDICGQALVDRIEDKKAAPEGAPKSRGGVVR